MKNKFYTSKGFLTAYALSCGYLETSKRCDGGADKRVSLSMEHGAYHVKGFDFVENRRICWEVFINLTSARKYFMQVLRAEGLKRKVNNGAV